MKDEVEVKVKTRNSGSWKLQRLSGKGLNFREESSHLSKTIMARPFFDEMHLLALKRTYYSEEQDLKRPKTI